MASSTKQCGQVMLDEIQKIRRSIQLATTLPRATTSTRHKYKAYRMWEDIDKANNVLWERWRVRTEPSEVGVMPFLIGKPANVPPTAKLPCIILLHGTGGSAESLQDRIKTLVHLGFLVASFDARYHGERTGDPGLGAYFDALISSYKTFGEQERPFIFDNVHDTVHLVDYLTSAARSDVLVENIGITGISLGGMHSWFAGALDERIKVVVPLIGVQYFQHAVQHNLYHARVDSIKPVFDHAAREAGKALDSAVVTEVWSRIVPGITGELDAPNSLKCIAPRPLLVVTGELDPRTPLAGVQLAVDEARRAYSALGASDNIHLHVEPKTGHVVTSSMWDAMVAFMCTHLLSTTADVGDSHL